MSHTARMTAVALVSAMLFSCAGLWLGLSYLGVVSRDVRVAATVTSFGDGLSPGAKVRFHGLIVGTVHDVAPKDAKFTTELLIRRDNAAAISNNVTARVLPSTLFGTNYVELVESTTPTAGDTAFTVASPLTSGAEIGPDRSTETVELMETLEAANKIISTIDTRQLNETLGSVATALDGKGDDLGSFIARADSVLKTLNANGDLFYDDLDKLSTATKTITAMEPHLESALMNARTTAGTVVERRDATGKLLDSTTQLSEHANTVLDRDGDRLVRLLQSTGPSAGLFAAHASDLGKVLAGVPEVLHNGANGVNDHAIQMIGKMASNPLDPYTSDDCPTYGTLQGSNCGGRPGDAPATSSAAKSAPDDEDSSAGADALRQKVAGLLPKQDSNDPVDPNRPDAGPNDEKADHGAGDESPAQTLIDLLNTLFGPLLGMGES